MAEETLLLTGATGSVGHEVFRTLLSENDPPRIFLLIRGEAARVSSKLAHLLSWAGADPRRNPDVVVVRGDASEPGLGMSREDRLRVGQEVTGILHMAATTDLDGTGDFNVVSTRHVRDLALSCRRLDRLGLISTAYVSGRRSGWIREGDLDFAPGFFNEYQESKAVAEREARRAMSALPIAIYRLSVVVGRQTDGRIFGSGLLAAACRLIRRGLLSPHPGDGEPPADLIPADFAGRSIVGLLRRGFEPGATYHVCAGSGRSLSLGAVYEAIDECLERADPGWKGRRSLPAGPRLLRKACQLKRFIEPLETQRAFDTSVFDAAMRRLGLELAHAREWIHAPIFRALA